MIVLAANSIVLPQNPIQTPGEYRRSPSKDLCENTPRRYSSTKQMHIDPSQLKKTPSTDLRGISDAVTQVKVVITEKAEKPSPGRSHTDC